MSRGDDLVIDRGDLVIDPIYLSIYLAQIDPSDDHPITRPSDRQIHHNVTRSRDHQITDSAVTGR
jgi:hypothetical protein